MCWSKASLKSYSKIQVEKFTFFFIRTAMEESFVPIVLEIPHVHSRLLLLHYGSTLHALMKVENNRKISRFMLNKRNLVSLWETNFPVSLSNLLISFLHIFFVKSIVYKFIILFTTLKDVYFFVAYTYFSWRHL